jgi:sucrose phosphorylase
MNTARGPVSFHLEEPNYTRPLFKAPPEVEHRIRSFLTDLYGDTVAQELLAQVLRVMAVYYAHKTDEMIQWERAFDPEKRFNEKDVILITYGDLVVEKYRKPLETLAELSRKYLRGVFNTIHILPFFPSSSDRGFSIRDFRQVDPDLGDWGDIASIRDSFKLMFDGVFNHVSSKSFWFQEFLNGNPDYEDFFTAYAFDENLPDNALKKLFRPRTTDVLTPFYTYHGRKQVWTTFSPDQIDLKFQNPRVLLMIIEILLYYVRRGADLIRLDAVTYLWDELGTTGAHLRQTHTIIRLFRTILDAVAPHVALVTETNVPHDENISYFGKGTDEAQLIYNFALPPLILHTFHSGSTARISRWASALENPSLTATYLNFLDSHDGVGVMGARDILSPEEIQSLADRVLRYGGFISTKKNSDGSESIYEFNITSFSALNREDEDVELQIRRYLAARSITLALIGVAGVYLHGLLGSRNDIDAVLEEQDKRSINRDVLSREDLIAALEERESVTSQVSRRLSSMIQKRTAQRAFNPWASQRVLDLSPRVFSVLRSDVDLGDEVLALTNVTGDIVPVRISGSCYNAEIGTARNIINGELIDLSSGTITVNLAPYEVAWFRKEDRE